MLVAKVARLRRRMVRLEVGRDLDGLAGAFLTWRADIGEGVVGGGKASNLSGSSSGELKGSSAMSMTTGKDFGECFERLPVLKLLVRRLMERGVDGLVQVDRKDLESRSVANDGMESQDGDRVGIY